MKWLGFRRWVWKSIVITDVWCNVVLFNGTPGMTLSARAYTARRDNRRWGIWLSALLNRIDPDHTTNAVQNDLLRAKAVHDELLR
jgi:hypothetical protein